MWTTLQSTLKKWAVTIFVGAVGFLLAAVLREVGTAIVPAIEKSVSARVLLILLCLSVLLNLAGASFAIYAIRKTKLRLRFGVYWDKDCHPHCPLCQSPLSYFRESRNARVELQCKKCRKGFDLSEVDGKWISVESAIERL